MSISLRLWHSGMLLILVLNSVKSVLIPPANFKIQQLNNNDSDEYKFQCVKDDQNYENLKFQWKLNEEILKNEESDIISVDYSTNLFEDDNIRLECLASNQAGTSWAFLDWSNATESWR